MKLLDISKTTLLSDSIFSFIEKKYCFYRFQELQSIVSAFLSLMHTQ